MARYVLAPFGGPGEVNPFIWLAKLLVNHGHAVRIVGTPTLGQLAGIDDFEFVSVGCEAEGSASEDLDPGDPENAAKLLMGFAARTLRGFYDAICMALLAEPAILVAPVHHLAARVVREKYNLPLVVVHTQPSWENEGMISTQAGRDDWLIKPSLELGWPKCARSGCTTAAIAVALRKFCHEVGVRAPRQRLQEWSHPADLDIMLFPEWFSDSPEGSAASSVFDGFPLEDLSGHYAMPDDLAAFLDSGEKPVLLTLEIHGDGSQAFFKYALRACGLLGVRALVATSHPERLPNPLPPWAHAMGYHPFSEILPRVRAAVHDGGIGTFSQCLAAAVPQLITPTLRSGQGNATWLRWFGAGEMLIPAQFSVQGVASSLLRLTSRTSVRAACDSARTLCRQKIAGPIALDALESIARSGRNRPAATPMASAGGRSSPASTRV